MRIVSLLPSATEIVCVLGLRGSLVGVTHECDYPPGLETVPRLTASLLDSSLSSREIDTMVARALTSDAHTIYALDTELLSSLKPDVVLTQSLCEVCAVPAAVVESAVCTMPHGARVVSLDPHDLHGIFESILDTACLLGRVAEGEAQVASLDARIARLPDAGEERPTVLAAEWLDPVYCGGHWVPEMIELAGGVDRFGAPGERSHPLTWTEIGEADPDVIVLMPCGYDAAAIASRYPELAAIPEWRYLRAVRESRVYCVDANSYFSRPGPRVVDGIEVLARIFHPDAASAQGAGLSLRLTPDGGFEPV
jgi:iron complex transport system substrate-binding protein